MDSIFLYGGDRLTYGIAINLIQTGHNVTLCSSTLFDDAPGFRSMTKSLGHDTHCKRKGALKTVTEIPENKFDLCVVLEKEDLDAKRKIVEKLDRIFPDDTVIAVNTEIIPLNLIQENCRKPSRILGLNWTEPAYNTSFLEIIVNNIVDKKNENLILSLSKTRWNKNPYVINGELGIRSRIFSSMVREAFYLVEHGYASIEDVDRAFRNDAGFYLPFCGNLRYMDLMGTYAYGLVMRDLNPDLSRARNLPDFFCKLIEENNLGINSGKGFYRYTDGEKEEWMEIYERFSTEIKKLMDDYPFDY